MPHIRCGSAGYPLFTGFAYDNLGVPKNLVNLFYTMPRKWNPDGYAWIDNRPTGLVACFAGLHRPHRPVGRVDATGAALAQPAPSIQGHGVVVGVRLRRQVAGEGRAVVEQQ